MIRQPVGVVAIVAPFNFPAMIPMWFLPYAVACGNTCVVKPSERVPLTMKKIAELIEEAKFPNGVVNLVNGARETVDADSRPSADPRGELRGLDGGRPPYLRARGRRTASACSARAGPKTRSSCCPTRTSR